MNKRILYIEDLAYGSDCVKSIASQIENSVNARVCLHDKLTEAAVEEFVQGDYDGVVSHLLHQSIRDSIDPDNRIRAREHESYRERLNYATQHIPKNKNIPQDYYFYWPYSEWVNTRFSWESDNEGGNENRTGL
jgi:hypothetical protein